MSESFRELPFKVDMAGIIEILGCSLYSRRDTAIRELLQNAHDAIARRRAVDLTFMGRIELQSNKEAQSISVIDNGVGITIKDAEEYLGTLGRGLSGLLKKAEKSEKGIDRTSIIGQFGVGLFSGFLIADKIIVESRKSEDEDPVYWEAGAGTSIRIGVGTREEIGTSVTLQLADEHAQWSEDEEILKETARHYADFLPVPIFLNGSKRRLNVMTPSWYESSPDEEMVSMELEERFDDNPLDVILVQCESPRIRGAIYITRQRTPGFSGRPLVTVTVRRMVLSTRLDGLFPHWGLFYRGVLELPGLQPTTSREDLIRNDDFKEVKEKIEAVILDRLWHLQKNELVKLQSIIAWHRYTIAGAALDEPQLRSILRRSYLFPTTKGPLTFEALLELLDSSAHSSERILWTNADRHQEQWISSVFAGLEQPCVQALRAFESTLLSLMVVDAQLSGLDIELQAAHPGNDQFIGQVLQLHSLTELDSEWQTFFSVFNAWVRADSFQSSMPVLAFPRRDVELKRDFDNLKGSGAIPSAFARMMDQHFAAEDAQKSQVILNRRHPIVARALKHSVHSPLASVLRLLIHKALMTAGAIPSDEEQETIRRDLDWIAETIVPKGDKDD